MTDELAAARARRDALRDELARAERELEGARDLTARRARIEAALREAERSLAQRPERRLPLLSRAYVASPCDARWEDMKGDARARHCASCDKTVFDLSAMRAEEAEALLAAHGESMCAQFYQRADGTILTADCPVGARRKMRRKLLATTVAALAAMGIGVVAHGLPAEPAPPPARASCGLELRLAKSEIPLAKTIVRASPNRPRMQRRGGVRLRPVVEAPPRPHDLD